MSPRTDRFGRPIEPGTNSLALQWGWRTIRCTGPCGQTVAVFEIPAGYLDDTETWGPYVCGECKDTMKVLT